MKAVIYARAQLNPDRQETEQQVAQLKDYADKNNIEVVESFQDFQTLAVPNSDRWVLKKCKAFCEAKDNAIDSVLTTGISCLGRSPYELLQMIVYFHDHHINLYFFLQNLYMFNEDGKDNPCFYAIFASFAKYGEQEGKEMQNTDVCYRKKGGKVGRKLGYRKSDETKKEQYHDVITKLQDGLSIREIAKLCGVSHSTVQRLKKHFNIKNPKKKSGDNV